MKNESSLKYSAVIVSKLRGKMENYHGFKKNPKLFKYKKIQTTPNPYLGLCKSPYFKGNQNQNVINFSWKYAENHKSKSFFMML